MLSIDEAIEIYKKIANTDSNCPRYCMNPCEKCVQESKQIAEWLEELKAIKSDGFTDNLLDIGFTKGYNKAIDECKSVILQTLDNEILVDTLYLRLEQLKEKDK